MAHRAAPPLDWDEEDEWVQRGWHRGYGHVPAPPYPRGSNDLLVPNAGYSSSSMRRSRSQGQAPAPNVYVYQGQRNISRSPSGRSPSRDRRRSRHDTEEIVDGLEDIAYEIRRGRSREPGHGWRDPSPAHYREMQLELARERDIERREWERETREREANQESLIKSRAEIRRLRDRISDAERDDRYRSTEEKLRQEIELEKIREEVKRRNDELKKKEDKERYWAEREREDARRKAEREAIWAEKEKEDRERSEERRRIQLELDAKEKDKKFERERVVAAYQDEQRKRAEEEKKAAEAAIAAHKKKLEDEKKKREELVAKIKQEEREQAEKDKAEKEEWRLKLEKEDRDKKEKEKKEKEKVEEEMRKKLSKFGFQENQIEAMIDPKKAEQLKPGQSPGNAIVPFQRTGPTYIKVHRNHIDVETLRYYALPWEYDSIDSNYIVILQEMDSRETDVLFEHTRKLRRGHQHLLIEDRGRDSHNPQYAFVRRRKPSASPHGRRRSSPKRVSLMFGL